MRGCSKIVQYLRAQTRRKLYKCSTQVKSLTPSVSSRVLSYVEQKDKCRVVPSIVQSLASTRAGCLHSVYLLYKGPPCHNNPSVSRRSNGIVLIFAPGGLGIHRLVHLS